MLKQKIFQCLALTQAVNFALSLTLPTGDDAPFLQINDDGTSVIGNILWNATMTSNGAKPAYYKGKDIVSNASGFYFSFAGQSEDFNWHSPKIVDASTDWIDVQYESNYGNLHWVIDRTTAGAWQYFMNTALPHSLGEFRCLWRLDNGTFTHGHNYIKDEVLPTLAETNEGIVVQDSTNQLPNGTYITKYDWSSFINVPEAGFWGVYGGSFGSWFIHPSKEYINGDHLKQELMVHRENPSGDTVQLNMLHGTHFMDGPRDDPAVNRTWGPWLWYLNDGEASDAATRAAKEVAQWPYDFPSMSINPAYQSRALSVKGRIVLTDDTPAANVSVFLGDNRSDVKTLDQGTNYYYRETTDSSGNFRFTAVRSGTYGLYAWPAQGSPMGYISTNFTANDISVTESSESLDIGVFKWKPQGRDLIWQLGTLDRLANEFKNGDSGYHHGLTDDSPANLTFKIGESKVSDWYYVQSAEGTWTIKFDLNSTSNLDSESILTVSVAGYGDKCYIDITAQGGSVDLGVLEHLQGDPSTYRSSTSNGVSRVYFFTIPAGTFVVGSNTIEFTVTNSNRWRGYMWDSILLEWA
ncbi:putative rhamnogalacturonase [Aspergillus japonicus CBS 114.51]|uniref:rhamnogalacturonan endolyase n=1 Tax=Aspergillus japonicus CBS 114.51 TaxID=1448312 RepID=A0A8T8XGP6_ASPJA|nr:putative rhamnogalacturonase [Aspergillus japonicus CBS 114.51]RAH86539.1 putative rhamnogalacturonase [Aspergillus japonicus CBS 114.51]